jgi:hypothetical protein
MPARHTDGNGPGSWPTPTAYPDGVSPKTLEMVKDGKAQNSLWRAVHLWPTPRAVMPDNLGPGAKANRKGRLVRSGGEDFGINLADAVRLYPTPRAGTDTMCGGSGHKAMLEGTDLQSGRGRLNPTWVEWLMGFPPGWTDLGASATPSSRKSSR